MSFYLPFYFIIFILAWFVKDKWSDILIVFLLLFFSMFRGENVGADTFDYLSRFSGRNVDLASLQVYELEFLYIWFEKLVIFLNLGTRYVLYFFSIITFYFLIKSSNRFNVSISLVCLFYVLFNYYFLSLNIARQFAAAAILLYAFSYLQYEDKRRLWFFVYVIFASGLHVTSLGFIVLYFSRYFNVGNIPKQYIITFLVAFYVFSLFFIGKFLEPVIDILLNYNTYTNYLIQTKEMSVTLKSFIFTTSMFIIKVVIFLQLRKEGANKTLLNLFLISILVETLFLNLWGNMARIKYSIGTIDLICYAYYFERSRLSFNKLVVFTITIVLYGYVLVWILFPINYYLEFKF